MTHKLTRTGPELTRRGLLQLAGAGAVLLGAAGCGTAGRAETGGATFVYGRSADATSLDPMNQTDSESYAVIHQIFDSLLRYAPDGTLLPALAAAVPAPENEGRQYTFELREDVRFHDGTPLDAEAVVFNFRRWRESDHPYHRGGGPQSSKFAYYKNLFGGFDDKSVISGVEAVGSHAVRFTLREPYGPFLPTLAGAQFGIASPTAIRQDVDGFWERPVGTGPFTLASWEHGSKITLRRNESWWGKRPTGPGRPVDTVVLTPMPDSTARVAALVGGGLDAVNGIVPQDADAIRDTSGFTVVQHPQECFSYFAMNTRRAPFQNPLVRKAIAHAIDLPTIVEHFFGERAEVAGAPLYGISAFVDRSIQPHPHDPELARKLLAEAGLPDGFRTSLWYMSTARPYLPDGKGVAQVAQANLADVGITAELVTYELATYSERTGKGLHDIAIYGGTTIGVDSYFPLNYWYASASATPESSSNLSFYQNSQVDALLAEARVTTDPEEQRALYANVQRIVHDEVPVLPIAYVSPPVALRSSVAGFGTNIAMDDLDALSR
ncbi:ABC transporter substrate-binding protein [Saccharopolyspora sp. WRP15-2]|uniref:ABC transporter substrate-binding protein n=1 Tax=Saccharopolyspora oryzae TaxID=2997343 RepID=A0ABT4V4N4_9PSEU|nr:ABC transporter substrate-binding protein [Saccharopolyspora oryzae]MDA3628359.1 ABC transporter substrate-binding protein [Saccharopolyspora oryzae]